MLSPCVDSSDTHCLLETSESLLTIQSGGSIFCNKNLVDEIHSVVIHSGWNEKVHF